VRLETAVGRKTARCRTLHDSQSEISSVQNAVRRLKRIWSNKNRPQKTGFGTETNEIAVLRR